VNESIEPMRIRHGRQSILKSEIGHQTSNLKRQTVALSMAIRIPGSACALARW